MDFFEAQARAKKRTHWLVLLFALAVVGTILAGYVATIFLLHYESDRPRRRGRYMAYERVDAVPLGYWDPRVFAGVTAGTLAVVGFASLYKWSQMRAGGSAIAEMVGGRPVNPKSTDLKERRLLNVVEEMSIASGIPMPAVFVLEEEPALNAFASGLTTSDAAVTVTRGTLDKLNRDELQGVIGHEFSHILNGDMRLNVRISAIVFGILVIGLLGRGILQSLGRGRVSGGGKKGGGIAVILAIGLVFMIIGYVGYFFGRLIQAAVSRQREFLADASAVQFTRNPGGVTGALKKIGGYALGGAIANDHAAEIGHFFFAQAFKSNFGGLWATHPPLEERIRAIDPQWDGKVFDPPNIVDIAHESSAIAGFGGGTRYTPDETMARVEAAAPDLPPPRSFVRLPFKPVAVVADVGALTTAHFRHAQSLLDAIPARLREAARETASAQVLVYGLLLGGSREERDRQQLLVAQHAGVEAAAALADLRSALSVLDPVARLPLLQLSLPSLRALPGPALEQFVSTLDELVHADGRVSPFEYALQKMLSYQLALAQKPAQGVQFDSLDAVRGDINVVLSALARAGNNDDSTAAAAFAEGLAQLPVLAGQLALLETAACGLEQVDAALDRLAVSSLPVKQRLLVAAAHTIASDGTVTAEEGDLFRAMAATLGCPMPTLGLAV